MRAASRTPVFVISQGAGAALTSLAQHKEERETVRRVENDGYKQARARVRTKVACFAGAALMVAAGSLLANDYEAGLDAFRAGAFQEALQEWQPLAEAGHPNAQHALGKMYEYGQGFERDDAQAASWYEKAAAQNIADAQYRLGVFHDNGWGVARDPSQAAKWYTRAAQLGHVFAQHDLAFMHLNGSGVPQDKIQAYKWLRIASTQHADLMAKHLQHVSKSMTPREIRQAETLARAWLNSQKI